MSFYWTLERFRDQYPSENADKVIECANALIETYSMHHDDDATWEYSEHLWNLYFNQYKKN